MIVLEIVGAIVVLIVLGLGLKQLGKLSFKRGK